jgi:hypothetical protein
MRPSIYTTHAKKKVSCRWCDVSADQCEMFRVRSGPTERWFCGAQCVELYVGHRHNPSARRLLDMSKKERNEVLEGRNMDWFIKQTVHASCLYPSKP